MTEKMLLWQKKGSKRYHWLRHCSGGMPWARLQVRRVRFDSARYDEARRLNVLCRCVPRTFRAGGHGQR